MRIGGSVAVVTGGSSGLGLATAQLMADLEAHVVIVDLPTSKGGEAAAAIGSGTQFAPADILDESQLNAALEIARSIGPIRTLIHCAGIGGANFLLDERGQPTPLERFERVLRLNLTGSLNVLRLVSASMAANEPIEGERGVAILTASTAAYEGKAGQIPYSASKAGVIGMTLPAARELGPYGIRVCSIAPGMFETPMTANRFTEQQMETRFAVKPFPKRMGQPSEFARLAVHVVENQMLNGVTLRIDGADRGWVPGG